MGGPLPCATLLALLLAAACSSQASEPPRSTPGFFVRVAGEGEPLLPEEGFEGVTIDVVPGVEYHLELTSTTPGTMQRLATINRHPFELDGDMLRIGPKSYGPVEKGDQVSITGAGVSINGEVVGELPPRPQGAADSEE